MSPRGILEPFIMASGNAVDQFVYRDSCLAPRLLPFIKTNHSDGNYIFWPDQAGCHYAEHSLDFVCENLIHHVDKGYNPANFPEVRPIEDFWSILKAKVYENNWEAKTLHQLEVRIKKCIKEVDQVKILKTIWCVNEKKTCRHSHVWYYWKSKINYFNN